MTLEEALKKINCKDIQAMEQANLRFDSIAKPIHSLGILEKNIIKCAGILGSPQFSLAKKAVVIMCADNGVVAQNITGSPSIVTQIMSDGFTKNNTCVCKMAETAGADVIPVDIGIAGDLKTDGILKKKIAYGTKDISVEPAMTREEAIQSIEVGLNLALELKEKGYGMIATGEMGIGNTTTSSAIAAVILQKPVKEVTGRGAGLSDNGIEHKINIIQKAIEVNGLSNINPEHTDPIDILASLGGFDIGGMVGLFLGANVGRIPVVIDGFISGISALLAVMIEPSVIDFILASHESLEPAGSHVLKKLGLRPLLNGDLCLGEGTGAVATFPIYDMMMNIYDSMCTFSDLDITAV